jgi:glycosyltransferase 2 family protein
MYLVARRVDWSSFVASIRNVNGLWLIAGVGASIASYVFAGLRWRHIIAPEVALTRRDAFDTVMIGNLANLVATARAGDLVRAVMVSRRGSAPIPRVLGGMVVERYADVAMLVTLAVGLSSVVKFPPAIRAGITVFTAVAVASLVAVFVAADRLPSLVSRVVGWVSPGFARRASSALEHVLSGMRTTGGRGSLAGTLLLSACVWLLTGVATLCNLHAFGLPVPWYAAYFLMLVINLGGIIPASPGSIGVYDYLTVLALSVWVADSSVALGFAIVAHAVGLSLVTLLGIGSLATQHESLFRVARSAQQEGAGNAA